MRELRVAMAEEDVVMANIVGGGECLLVVGGRFSFRDDPGRSEKHVNLTTRKKRLSIVAW